MTINGKEINFKFTVRAQINIAALCPDRKWKNLQQLFSDDLPDEERAKNLFEIGRIMNNNYEQSKRKERGEPVELENDYSRFSFDDYLDLSPAESAEYESELVRAINVGTKRNVEAAPPKGKKNGKGQESN